MTVRELFTSGYQWMDEHAIWFFIAAILLPLLGAGLAWIGKGGRTDRDGRVIASVFVGLGFILLLLEFSLVVLAKSIVDADIWSHNALLLISPLLYLVIAVSLIRTVFPLSQLGSVRQAGDIAAFLVVCLAVVWLFKRFHWGVVFFGSITQMLIIAVIAGVFIYRMALRAAGE